MSIVICPNCNMKVIPRSDGTCPSCQFEIVQAAQGVDIGAPAPQTAQGIQAPDAQAWVQILMILVAALLGLILIRALYSFFTKSKRR